MAQLDATEGLPEPHPHQPVRYIDRTRAWYSALGYEPYRWPCYTDVPFQPLSRPLAESRLALVTTAAPYRSDLEDQGPGAKYNGAAKFFDVFTRPMNPASVTGRDTVDSSSGDSTGESSGGGDSSGGGGENGDGADDPHDLRISHIGYDRNHSKADDRNTWLPVPRLNDAVEAGRIGGLTERIYAAPTVRRQRSTTEEHAPQISKLIKEDMADIALLVPT